jgi:hypothetical protein
MSTRCTVHLPGRPSNDATRRPRDQVTSARSLRAIGSVENRGRIFAAQTREISGFQFATPGLLARVADPGHRPNFRESDGRPIPPPAGADSPPVMPETVAFQKSGGGGQGRNRTTDQRIFNTPESPVRREQAEDRVEIFPSPTEPPRPTEPIPNRELETLTEAPPDRSGSMAYERLDRTFSEPRAERARRLRVAFAPAMRPRCAVARRGVAGRNGEKLETWRPAPLGSQPGRSSGRFLANLPSSIPVACPASIR